MIIPRRSGRGLGSEGNGGFGQAPEIHVGFDRKGREITPSHLDALG